MKETKKRGRPEKLDGTQGRTQGFRLTDDIISKLDLIAERMSKETGFTIDRSNVVRKALNEFIERNL